MGKLENEQKPQLEVFIEDIGFKLWFCWSFLIISDHFPMIFIHFPTRMTLPRQFWMPQNPLPGCVPFRTGFPDCVHDGPEQRSAASHGEFTTGFLLGVGHGIYSLAISGTDWLEVPIPYMFGPKFQWIFSSKIWSNIWYVYGYLHFRILSHSHWFIVQLDWWMHSPIGHSDWPAQMKRSNWFMWKTTLCL